MDLKHDWRVLNEVLFPRESMLFERGSHSALVLIQDKDRVIDGVASTGVDFFETGQEISSDKKTQLDALSEKYGVKETAVLSKQSFENLLYDASLQGTNYFQQLEIFRQTLFIQEKSGSFFDRFKNKPKEEAVVSRKHFVLDFFAGPIQKFFPRKFNVLIFIDERTVNADNVLSSTPKYRAVVLTYSKGELEQFFEPDLTGVHENRLVEWERDFEVTGQYLENRYILPCYGIFTTAVAWERGFQASQSAKDNPWSVLLAAHSKGEVQFYPKNFLVKSILAVSPILRYLSRR